MRRLISLVLLSSALILVGCAPRGETKSLDEILATAKERYQAVAATGMDKQISDNISSLVSSMANLEKSPAEVATAAKSIADGLAGLERHAGFTSRAAIGEIIGQYRSMVDSDKSHAAAAASKLLVARTYNLLASELETTKFAVQ